jgi:hypothetical protein
LDVAPNLQSVTPLSRYREEHAAEIADIDASVASARAYVSSFSWLKAIREIHVGAIYPGVISILLLRVEPARPDIDEWIWIIGGDLPPAYITCDQAVVPWEALDGYIGALEPWIAAVRAGESVSKLMPVNAAPTIENADALERRLKFLDEKIMPLLGGPQPRSA